MHVSTSTPTHSETDAAIVLAWCAEAAMEWYGGNDRGRAAASLAQAMSRAAKLRKGEFPARKPHEMLALFVQPTASWLTWGADAALVENGAPTAYCEDLLAEAGKQPDLELVQRQIDQARTRLKARKEGEREYRELRRFLITHGHVRQSEAERVLIPGGLAFADMYEPVLGDRRIECRGRSVFFPCPRCTWPMQVRHETIRCASPACREEGASFHYDAEKLLALGALEAPAGVEVEGRFMLRRAIWRYTLLPGLAELDLARQLEQLPDVRVELWPQCDQFDLLVACGDVVIRADVKDWSDPAMLARRLLAQPPPQGITIVLPDRRRSQMHVLRERCAELRFMTVSDLVSTIRQVASGSDR